MRTYTHTPFILSTTPPKTRLNALLMPLIALILPLLILFSCSTETPSPQPAKTTYTVTFDPNGGTAVAPIANLLSGAAIKEPVAPTQLGFKFKGWYKGEGGTGEAFNFGTDTITADITLYAKWEAEVSTSTYTVTFEVNGGTTVAELKVKTGKQATKPTDPTRTGYTFGGWYQEVALTNVFDFSKETITGNITLYAKWLPEGVTSTYTVTFEVNGGTTVAELKVETGKQAIKPTDPTRTDYTFDGWYKEVALTNVFDFETETITGNITLYAKWLPEGVTSTYTITFNSQGGSAVAPIANVLSGATIKEPVAPMQLGFKFKGWYKGEGGTGEAFNFETGTITGNITLYAKWVAQSVESNLLSLTLTLRGNQVRGRIKGTIVRFSVADKSFMTATIKTITLSAQATSEGEVGGTLTFTSSTSNLTVTAEDGTTTKTYTLKLVSNQTQLTSLSLTIAGATYPVTFPEGQTTTSLAVPDDAVGSATIQSLAVSADASANPVEGTSLTFTDKQASLTVTAEDGTTTKTYTIALQNANLALSALTLTIAGVEIGAKIVGTAVYVGVADKTAVSTATIQQITVGDGATASPTNGASLPFTSSNGEQTATITVAQGGATAEYTVKLQNTTRKIISFVFEVTQNGEGGLTADITGVITDATDTREDAGTITLQVPALESLSFVPTIQHNGERITPATGQVQDFSTQVTYQVTSEYGSSKTYTVTVEREDPVYTFVLGEGILAGDNPLTLASGSVPDLPAPTRAGYRFVGWFTDAGLTTAYEASQPAVFSRTLYASWAEIPQFTVSFEVNGGSAVDPQQVEEGKNVAKPVDPTRTDYTFDGWYKEVALTNVFDFSKETITGNITLYAKWLPEGVTSTYTITFDSREGTTVAEFKVEVGKQATKPADPIRTGYTFAGWYKEVALTHVFDFETETITGNITLYAKWEKVETVVMTFERIGNRGPEELLGEQHVVKGESLNSKLFEKLPYTLIDLYTDEQGTKVFDRATVIEANRTLYVKWGVRPKYKGELIQLINTELNEQGNKADLNFIDTRLITDMSNLFTNKESFNGDISGWNVAAVTNMSNMFSNAIAFNQDISGWNVAAVTNMSNMFFGASAFNGDISRWNVVAVTNMNSMFYNTGDFNQDISGWNVAAVTNMSNMFRFASAFNKDLEKWNVASSVNKTDMFTASRLTEDAQPSWYRPKLTFVTTMEGISVPPIYLLAGRRVNGLFLTREGYAFQHWSVSEGGGEAFDFNQKITTDITLYAQWKEAETVVVIFKRIGDRGPKEFLGVQNVTKDQSLNSKLFEKSPYALIDLYTDAEGVQVFDRTTVIEADQTLYVKWVARPKDKERLIQLIDAELNARGNEANLNFIDTQLITDMSRLFEGKTSFNGDISKWNVAAVTNMGVMFHTARAFNQDISKWNVATVRDMSYMFLYANAFNQDLEKWNVASSVNKTEMFNYSGVNSDNNNIPSWY